MSLAKGVAQGMLDPVGRGILTRMVESIWQVGFARSLGIHDAMEITSLSPNGSLVASFRVPEHVITPSRDMTEGSEPCSGTGDRMLSCGVTTALFDEVSTVAMLIGDRAKRPGVSVSLSCEVFHPVAPGERVTFTSHPIKMGARLGYGEAHMYTEEGLLAARGRHIKYLPMGVAWDLTGTIPGLFPIAARLFDWRHNLWARDPERTLGVPDGQSLHDIFPLEVLRRQVKAPPLRPTPHHTLSTDPPVPLPHHLTVGGGRGGDKEGVPGGQPAAAARERGGDSEEDAPLHPGSSALGQGDGAVPSSGVGGGGLFLTSGEVSISRRHCNYIPGTMHGGAVAVAAEMIGGLCLPPRGWGEGEQAGAANHCPHRLRSMEIHYLSPVKRRALLEAELLMAPHHEERQGGQSGRERGKGSSMTVRLSEASASSEGGALKPASEALLFWE